MYDHAHREQPLSIARQIIESAMPFKGIAGEAHPGKLAWRRSAREASSFL
jgi:hypothetical protein